MINQEIQNELLKITLTPENALNLAMTLELIIQSQIVVHSDYTLAILRIEIADNSRI